MCIRDSIKGVNPETEEEETRPSSDDAPFAALAFKIATDPFVGDVYKRQVDVSQDVIVREIDCGTTDGLWVSEIH